MTTSFSLSGNLSKGRGGPTAGGAVRKLTIKPLKSKPKLPDDFEVATLAKLLEAVHAVQKKEPVSSSLEELYQKVEDMCKNNMAAKVYNSLEVECDQHIKAILSDLCRGAASTQEFLQQVDTLWEEHCGQMLKIRSIFLYLDRSFVISNPTVRGLFDLGLQLFKTHLQSLKEQESKVVEGLLELIELERRGETVPRSLLTHLVHMFTSLGTFLDVFQKPFLTQTRAFYKAEGMNLIETLQPAAYLEHCEKRIQEEYDRCNAYLEPSTRRPLIRVMEEELLEAHLVGLLNKGFDNLMAEERVADLARLYNLAGRIQAQEAVKQALRNYVKNTGSALVMDEEKDKDMVLSLLKMKASVDLIHREAFQSNELFGNALKESFEYFINQRPNRPAELIAKFVDGELKAGSKGHNEAELEENLDKALMLFRYIQGKDVFEAFYKKDLAKRLLMGRSTSTDAEKNMVQKLKAECGSQFTNKLEGMFKDVEVSTDIMQAFKTHGPSNASMPPGIDMNVFVLTQSHWPTYPQTEARLPDQLVHIQEVFKTFYLERHQNRRLQWHDVLGTCVVRANFPKGTKELSVSLFQAVVLMLFNDADELSLQDIKGATGIEERELARTLQSLACGKVRVLLKEPRGKEVETGDKFMYNKDFTAQLFRIKINSIQLRETVEENQKTNQQVMQDRQHQVDAAVVRIMKARKVLSHKLLKAELVNQLRFPIKDADMKRRVESLIERDFIARSEGDAQVYQYLA